MNSDSRIPNPESLTAEEQAYWDQWDRGYAHWRKRVFLVFWISYGSFYLCRVNFSVAIPGIMEEFGWNRAQLGAIGTAMFWTYAVGQVIHGHLAERFSSRVYLRPRVRSRARLRLAHAGRGRRAGHRLAGRDRDRDRGIGPVGRRAGGGGRPVLVVAVNAVPPHPYHAHWLPARQPGRLRDVAAASDWLARAWPYALLGVLLWSMARRPPPGPSQGD